MEQLSFFSTEENSWQEKIQAVLNTFVQNEELPKGSIYLGNNYSTIEKEKITSNSIFISEPAFPEGSGPAGGQGENAIVLRVNEKNGVLHFFVSENSYGDLPVPDFGIIKKLAQTAFPYRITVDIDNENYLDYVYKQVKYAYMNYQSKAARFGCCSKFEECSNAKKCLHTNKLYARACSYREHLEAGEIFYGANKNI